jgi:hypothetical protein
MKPKESLLQFFRNSPLVKEEMVFDRVDIPLSLKEEDFEFSRLQPRLLRVVPVSSKLP